jgi:hypothetical protein
MKTIINKINGQLERISKLGDIEGKLTINVEHLEAKNYNDLENKINHILNSINIPDGFYKNEHFIYNSNLEICIFFK